MNVLLALGLLVGACLGAMASRRWVRLRRLRRCVLDAEVEVMDAIQEGRLEAMTGEALLQHLEGLRHEARAGRGW